LSEKGLCGIINDDSEAWRRRREREKTNEGGRGRRSPASAFSWSVDVFGFEKVLWEVQSYQKLTVILGESDNVFQNLRKKERREGDTKSVSASRPSPPQPNQPHRENLESEGKTVLTTNPS